MSQNPSLRAKINRNQIRMVTSRSVENLLEVSPAFSSMIRCAKEIASYVHHQVKIRVVKLGRAPWGFRIDGRYVQGPLSYAVKKFIAGVDDSELYKRALSSYQLSYLFRDVDDQIVIASDLRTIEDKHRLNEIRKLKIKADKIMKKLEDMGPIGKGILVGGNLHDVPRYYQAPSYWKRTVTYVEDFTDPYNEDGIPGPVVETQELPIPLSSAYFSNYPKAVYLREVYDKLILKIGRITIARLPLYVGKKYKFKSDGFMATNIRSLSFEDRDEFVKALHKKFFLFFPDLKKKSSAVSIPPGMMEHAIYVNELGGSATVSRNQKQWMMTYAMKEFTPDSESEVDWPPRISSIAYFPFESERRTERDYLEHWLRGKRIGFDIQNPTW